MSGIQRARLGRGHPDPARGQSRARAAARRAPRRALALAVLALALSAWPAPAHGRAIRFERLSTDDGLSQSTVMCVLQDRQGFMWFGTEAGLDRYDGRRIRVYRRDVHDPRSLPSDFVWALAEDAAGDLWVATEGGGLARWERQRDRFVRYPIDPEGVEGVPSGQLRTVHVDRNGVVWAGTKDAGLARFDPRSGAWRTFRHVTGDPTSLADDGVYAVREDAAGRLWVGTNGGLSLFEAHTERFHNFRHDPRDPSSLADDRVRDVREDRQGRLWVATFGGGIGWLSRDSRRFEHIRHRATDPAGLADDFVHALHEDAAGRLWVATRSGLQLREHDGSFTTWRHNAADTHSLGDDDVLSVFEDRGGVLWFGTRAGGVARFDPGTWAFGLVRAAPGDPQGLGNGYVTSFSEDPHGRLWIGTLGGGLYEWQRRAGVMRRHTSGPGGLAAERVMALLHDRAGVLWVGTMDGGLRRIDHARGRLDVFSHDPTRSDSLSADGVMALLEDRRGTLWIGTYGGGLNRLGPDGRSFSAWRHDPNDPDSLSRDVVTALAEDPSGALWIGTEGGGLNRLDPRTGGLKRFTHDDDDPNSIADDTVYALHVEADGTLWVGTRAGLSRLAPDNPAVGSRSYTSSDGLAGNVVYGIEADAAGRLWLSGSQGLLRFDPRAGVFKQYTATQGLQGDEFNFGAHYRGRSGELFFGGPTGFNAFDPERLRANSVPPSIALTALLKFGQPAEDVGPAHALRSLALGYRDTVVGFEFAALHYASPARNRLAYKLDGFDDDWIDIGGLGRVTLTNLDAGDYTLRVRAANADGTWSDDGWALPLRVAAPPWRSPWAYAAYVLSALALAGAAVRVQRRKSAREVEYRRRLELEVRERTRELDQRNQELERVNTRLAQASLTDPLTGLRNRRYLFEHVAPELAALRRRTRETGGEGAHAPRQPGFIMVDLDWFKPINDTCGHAAGDRLLLQVKGVLERVCGPLDELIRWGGDEFLVVTHDSDSGTVEALPERIRDAIEQTAFDLGDGRLAHVTCSIGFTLLPDALDAPESHALEQVVALADQALCAAKRCGRNAWVGLLTTRGTNVRQALQRIQSDPDAVATAGLDVRRSTLQPHGARHRPAAEPTPVG